MFITLEDGFLVIRVPIKTEIIPALEMHPEVAEAKNSEKFFTRREMEVIKALIEFDRPTNKDIAIELNISERTVKYHVSEILDKIGLSGGHGKNRSTLIDLLKRKFGTPKEQTHEVIHQNSHQKTDGETDSGKRGPRVSGVPPRIPTLAGKE